MRKQTSQTNILRDEDSLKEYKRLREKRLRELLPLLEREQRIFIETGMRKYKFDIEKAYKKAGVTICVL